MELGERDRRLAMVRKELAQQKQLLSERFARLQEVSNRNVFLKEVENDYRLYYAAMKAQKEEQQGMLEMISEYLSDVARTADATGAILQDARADQQRTIDEIQRVKGEIAELVDLAGPAAGLNMGTYDKEDGGT